MPKGTEVEKLYEKFKGEGKSKASAAKLAQWITKKSLKTGKAPKHSNMFRSAVMGD